jgi:predicted nucleotidyltransferase
MDDAFLIAIFAIVFGSLLSGYLIWKIIDLIKYWITPNNSSYDEEKIDRIAKAFVKHKKDTERRLQNIEAIITDDHSIVSEDSVSRQLRDSQSHTNIEIEPKDSETKQKNVSAGNLNNMLHKKRKE